MLIIIRRNVLLSLGCDKLMILVFVVPDTWHDNMNVHVVTSAGGASGKNLRL